MSSNRQDFEMQALRSKDINFSLTDAGSPLDLTGATLSWRMGPLPSGAAILQKTTALGITVTDAVNGALTLSISSTDVPDAGVYWHDLSFSPGAGMGEYTVSSGRVVVMPSVAPQL